jgi:hypothetical protein
MSGARSLEDFQFFVLTSTPMWEEDPPAVPFVLEGHRTLRRVALVLSTKLRREQSQEREYYFTIGHRDSDFTARRYRNPDLTSRSIMSEVGRVF